MPRSSRWTECPSTIPARSSARIVVVAVADREARPELTADGHLFITSNVQGGPGTQTGLEVLFSLFLDIPSATTMPFGGVTNPPHDLADEHVRSAVSPVTGSARCAAFPGAVRPALSIVPRGSSSGAFAGLNFVGSKSEPAVRRRGSARGSPGGAQSSVSLRFRRQLSCAKTSIWLNRPSATDAVSTPCTVDDAQQRVRRPEVRVPRVAGVRVEVVARR